MSLQCLTTLFRQEYGPGIDDFLQEYQFERAFYLLVHTKLQVAEIAHRLGYSPAHFSTAFKKRFGRQPNQYKNLQQLTMAMQNRIGLPLFNSVSIYFPHGGAHSTPMSRHT